MAKGNIAICMAIIYPFEGGYVDHPKDPGGATNMGITLKTLQDWRGRKVSKADVKALTKAEADAIYEKRYWKLVNGDALFRGVDLITVDSAINSGVSRANKWLGQAVDSRNRHDQTVKNIAKIRMSFLNGLGTFKVFGKGWTRRVTTMEAHGVAMALAAMTTRPSPVSDTLKEEADKAKSQSTKNGTAATGSATATGATTAGGASPETVQNTLDVGVNSTVLYIIAAVALFATIYFAWHWWTNRARSRAFTEVAGVTDEKPGK